jgi:hypothetical protein
MALRNKTYPLRIVLDAITLYDLGYLRRVLRASC